VLSRIFKAKRLLRAAWEADMDGIFWIDPYPDEPLGLERIPARTTSGRFMETT